MTGSLAVDGITHVYGAKTALDDVRFSVDRGAFCALLGPNGAGKSTLFALMTRLFVPKSGRIVIGGADLAVAPREALARMGVVFQQPTLDLDVSVRRNLLYFAALHGLRGAKARSRADAVLDQLSMGERADEIVRALNGGHRRRLEIARALMHEPEVLLLDEPTVGLDAQTRSAITDHVHGLASETGMTVLWATHLVDEVWPQDRLIVLHRGRIVADGIAGDIAADASLADRFAALTSEAVPQ